MPLEIKINLLEKFLLRHYQNSKKISTLKVIRDSIFRWFQKLDLKIFMDEMQLFFSNRLLQALRTLSRMKFQVLKETKVLQEKGHLTEVD